MPGYRKGPDFHRERKLWKKGYKFVAGGDEVGRGSFAGPVVAAVVVFPGLKPKERFTAPSGIRIDDSKKLTAIQREKAGKWIRENALAWGVGEVSARKINRIKMAKATQKAFRTAISQASAKLKNRIDFLLLDAFFIPYVRQLPIGRKRNKKGKYTKTPKSRQIAIIDGDEKCLSIAAASIIAKTYRDKLMISLGKRKRYSKYLWHKNKGYGTKEHILAIKKHGITGYHRRDFIKR